MLRQSLCELASARVRWDYRRLHILLKRECVRTAVEDLEAQVAEGERDVEHLGEPQPSGAVDELAGLPGDASSGGRPPCTIECTRHLQNAPRALAAARDWLAKAIDGRAV